MWCCRFTEIIGQVLTSPIGRVPVTNRWSYWNIVARARLDPLPMAFTSGKGKVASVGCYCHHFSFPTLPTQINRAGRFHSWDRVGVCFYLRVLRDRPTCLKRTGITTVISPLSISRERVLPQYRIKKELWHQIARGERTIPYQSGSSLISTFNPCIIPCRQTHTYKMCRPCSSIEENGALPLLPFLYVSRLLAVCVVQYD